MWRDRTRQFYRAMGWAPIGYASRPLQPPNDFYTARPMVQPFDRAWQGFQKHQQEADMVTEWNTVGYRNSYQTTLLDTGRFQQDGSFHQISGSYGTVPATAIMTAPKVMPQPQGLFADFVRAVKRNWQSAPNA